MDMLPKKVLAAFKESGGNDSAMPGEVASGRGPLRIPAIAPAVQQTTHGVVVDPRQRVAVPSFTGQALRNVVETAAGAGLKVETVGSGSARDQAPAAGTMVPLGTQVIVRFAR